MRKYEISKLFSEEEKYPTESIILTNSEINCSLFKRFELKTCIVVENLPIRRLKSSQFQIFDTTFYLFVSYQKAVS